MPVLPLTFLATQFGLQNTRIVNGLTPGANPFTGKIPGTTPDSPLYNSVLGTPVYTNLEFQAGSWQDNQGNTHTWDALTLDTVLITVEKIKNIISTSIQGRDGTIKEYIGDGDYVITVNGMITGGNTIRPVQDIATFNNIVNAKAPIAVNSNMLTPMGVYNIVITRCTYPSKEGSYSYQLFSLSALSDFPIELKTVK